MGGLGNQLFQIFATIAYCIEHKLQFVFPYSEILTAGITRPTYWNTMLTNLMMYTTAYPNSKYTNTKIASFPTYKEPRYKYNKIPTFADSNLNEIMLYGYFQSYKYFSSYEESIYSLIGVSELVSSIKNEFADLFTNRTTISMHFRLGDYKNVQQCHPIMTDEYYYQALTYIVNKNNSPIHPFRVLYFCEQEDNAHVNDVIDRIHETNRSIEFIKVDDTICDWKQLLIMSVCNNHIIANSSFSWWGAYLNPSTSKIVCYPSTWFGPAMNNHNTDELFPSGWTKLTQGNVA
jgi:hypothetical protein